MWFKNGKILTIESLVFEVLSSFQNYKFCEDCTKIPCFIDREHSKVDRRHLYEWCEKKYCAELSWDEEEMDGQSWPSNVTLHKIMWNSSIFGQKNSPVFGTVLTLAVFCTPCMISLSHVHPFCNMGKEKNLEVELLDAAQAWKKNLPTRLKKSKWDIVSVKKMVWHVPHTIGPYIIS
jgi:hypothetical protein